MENIADIARESKEIQFHYPDLLACDTSDMICHLDSPASNMPTSNHTAIGLKSPAYLEIMH